MGHFESWDDWERNIALGMLQTVDTAAQVVHGVVQSVMECCSAATESLQTFSYEATKKVTLPKLQSLYKDQVFYFAAKGPVGELWC